MDRKQGRWSSAGGRGLLAIALALLLAGCATATARRPSTLSDLLLALDGSEQMGGDSRCRDRTVATTEVIVPVELAPQGVSGRWTERWTVDRCGVLVPYVVKFDRAPDGDLDVSMQRETSDGAPVPGATMADRVLQGDTLAFLAQRDLLEAGPEARCRTRKIVATEVVAPLEDAQVEGDRPVAGKWSELWTLDRCGMPIGYLIRFNTTRNGTSFVAERQR
ncbi:MAG TPA: hypothetical protein VIG37_18485 [Methylomirabilota bacterium]